MKNRNRLHIIMGGVGILVFCISLYLTLRGTNEFLRFQIFSLTDIRFWAYFLFTLMVSFYSFFIPGDFFTRRFSRGLLARVVLGTTFGMVLWGFQGFIFGFLDLRILTYVYLFVMLGLWLWKIQMVTIPTFSLFHKIRSNFVIVTIISVGTIVMVLPLWFAGFASNDAIEFCCFWPDNLYHLAIVNQLVQNVPPIEPGASGVIMQNYHYFANLIMADSVRVFHIPLIHLQNQYMPVFITVLFGLQIVVLARQLTKSKNFVYFLLFFLFFSGDIVFLILLVMGQPINFAVGASENATTLWFSPPRMFAMLVLVSSLSLFVQWTKNKSLSLGVILALSAASLIGMKIYIGAFLFLGLAGVGVYFLYKREWKMVLPLLVAVGIGLALYLPVNPHSGGLVFTGLWRIEDFAVKKEFGLLNVELARYIFLAHNNYPRIIIIEVLYALIFFASLGGMFLIGFAQSRKSIKRFRPLFHTVLLVGLVSTTIIGLFFIQETGGANTSQFFMSTYVVGSLYAALACAYWTSTLKNKRIVYILIVVVGILTSAKVIAETYENIHDIAKKEGYLTIHGPERHALEYMRKNLKEPEQFIANPEFTEENNCYYAAYLANQVPFLCGTGILVDHGVKIEKRSEVLDTIFTEKDPNIVLRALTDNDITHLYITDPKKYGYIVESRQYTVVFREGNFVILKVL